MSFGGLSAAPPGPPRANICRYAHFLNGDDTSAAPHATTRITFIESKSNNLPIGPVCRDAAVVGLSTLTLLQFNDQL